MKSLRKLLAVLALTFALSVSALAGNMDTVGITSTGEMGTVGIATGNTDTGATATGNMETVGIATTDPVTGTALSLLQSVLSLF